jgi:hypothetical protein
MDAYCGSNSEPSAHEMMSLLNKATLIGWSGAVERYRQTNLKQIALPCLLSKMPRTVSMHVGSWLCDSDAVATFSSSRRPCP